MILRKFHGMSALLASLLVIAGCATAPQFDRPSVEAPAAFKEAVTSPAQAGDAVWQPANPADGVARGEWWRVFNDDTLNGLQVQAQQANQNVKAAAARVAQARALQQDANSERSPQIGVGAGPTRQRASPASQGIAQDGPNSARTLWRAQATASYEVDLFGRVASVVDAAQADTQEREALYHSVMLALQADVAQTYFTVREQDAELRLFRDTVDLRAQTLKLVDRRFTEGDISELDLARSRTELASAQSELLAIERRRAASEHALATLLGRAPSDFTLAALPLDRVRVSVPPGLPSSLLERRPDIAAAERAMAAANARIGAANAAFFPRLELTGAAGFESGKLGDLFNWSSRSFLLGPVAGTILSLPIFDGGRRQAGLDRARAVYEEDVANYRQTVLVAFREVEDGLSNLRILSNQTVAQDEAVKASERAARLSQIQYREGAVNYLDVIDADRSVLAQRRVGVNLDGERARSTVALIRAMGGGWDISQAAVAVK